MVFCSLMVKTLSRCSLLCFRGSSYERGSWELNVVMAQLLQVFERNWLCPRSGEEHSAVCSQPHFKGQCCRAWHRIILVACEKAAGETGLGLGESRD